MVAPQGILMQKYGLEAPGGAVRRLPPPFPAGRGQFDCLLTDAGI